MARFHAQIDHRLMEYVLVGEGRYAGVCVRTPMAEVEEALSFNEAAVYIDRKFSEAVAAHANKET